MSNQPANTQYTPGSVTKLSTIPYPSNDETKRCSSPAMMASIAEEIIGHMAASKMQTWAVRVCRSSQLYFCKKHDNLTHFLLLHLKIDKLL